VTVLIQEATRGCRRSCCRW